MHNPPKMEHYVIPPEDTVHRLRDMFNQSGDIRYSASLVAGADASKPGFKELPDELRRNRGTFLLSTEELNTEFDGDMATITVQITLQDNLRNRISQTERLLLRKLELEWQTGWQAVPGEPGNIVDDKSCGILLRLATFIAHPREMLDLTWAASSLLNVRQIALGAMMYIYDYRHKIDIKPDGLKQALMPYVQQEQIFFSPVDKSGEVSYALNSRLSGVPMTQIAKPAETVLLYEGKNDELAFRHNGRSIVAFADGRAQMVTVEEAESLRWEP